MNRAEQIIDAALNEWRDPEYAGPPPAILIARRLRAAGIDTEHTYTECRDGDGWVLCVTDKHDRDFAWCWSAETQWSVPGAEHDPEFVRVFVRRPLDGEG